MKAQINVEFNESPNRQELQSGEEIKTLFGKIKKWLTDLKPVAFSGSYNDLTDTPDAAITTNAENIANIQTALSGKASSADVYTKSETDTKITEKVAEIVAGAPADFDTLKEMSDWIANHEGSAAAMNAAINTNSTNISNLQAEIGDIETVLSSVVEVAE